MRVSIAAVLLVLTMGAGLHADDKPADQPDPAAMEQMMMELAKLGPQHEQFKELVGEWSTKSTDFTTGGENPAVTHGTATFELLMGGRYLKQTFKGEYSGMPYEGIGISGYDNAQQKYVGTWIDNFSTGMMHFSGTMDGKTGVMTEIGEFVTPVGTMKSKMVTEPQSEDAFLFTMSMLGPDGGETKHMTIEYERKK